MFFLLALCECDREEREGQNFAAGYGMPVRVEAAADVPGCFVLGGQFYGLYYGLAEAYAAATGRELDFSAGALPARMWNDLRNNGTDIGVAMSSEVEAGALSLPVLTTGYVVLAADTPPAEAGGLSGIVGNGKVAMPESFVHTDSYGMVLDSLSGAQLYVSPADAGRLVAELERGTYDFLVCERGEAALVGACVPGLREVYAFGERVEVSLVFSPGNPALYYDFRRWFGEYRQTEAYAALQGAYCGDAAGGLLHRVDCNSRVPGGISVWDGLIREVGLREGVDWRLLSAIAYKESRFRHNVVSPSGARGLMQIMPVTARHFHVDQWRLADPEVNVTLAARLIRDIEHSLQFAEGTPDEDRLSIVLAGYNCGIGTVRDARRLAEAEGENPDSWAAVSHCLELMGDSSYVCDSVRYRRFRGCGETFAFVDGVKRKYYNYLKAVPV